MQVTAAGRFGVPGSNPLPQGRHDRVGRHLRTVAKDGWMQINLVLQTVGTGTIMPGVFSASWFGRLELGSAGVVSVNPMDRI